MGCGCATGFIRTSCDSLRAPFPHVPTSYRPSLLTSCIGPNSLTHQAESLQAKVAHLEAELLRATKTRRDSLAHVEFDIDGDRGGGGGGGGGGDGTQQRRMSMNTLVRMNDHFSAGERRLQDQVVALTTEREALIEERDQLLLAMTSEQGEHGEYARKASLASPTPYHLDLPRPTSAQPTSPRPNLTS